MKPKERTQFIRPQKPVRFLRSITDQTEPKKNPFEARTQLIRSFGLTSDVGHLPSFPRRLVTVRANRVAAPRHHVTPHVLTGRIRHPTVL